MSTNPNDPQHQPGPQVPGQNGNWWSSDPWADQQTTPDPATGGPAAGGGVPTVPYGAPGPTVPADSPAPFGPPPPGGVPGYDPGYGANQGAGYGAANQGAGYGGQNYGGQGGYGAPADPAAFYIGYEPHSPQQPSHTGRNLAAVLGAVGVVATLVIVLVVADNHHSPSTNTASSTTSSSTTATGDATDTATATATDTDTSTDGDVTPTDTDTGGDLATDSVFDPSSMSDASTDTAPFTTDAMLPETFTDAKDIEYQLEAGGVETCVQSSMTSNVQGELRKYGCSKVLTGSYTVDSSTVTSDSDILVSVQIFAFNDESTAKTVYADFPSNKSWDFGIWCPKTGHGANPCSANADYSGAYKSEWISQDYRYVIEATAMYTDMTSDSSVGAWTSAAAKEAVDEAGPTYYISSQD
jgi:hypothetical protein